MTSHAAVVARGMGKCCVTGCSDLEINTVAKTVYYDGGELHEGDTISVDGTKGDIYIGEIETVSAEHSEEFTQFMEWSGGYCTFECSNERRDALKILKRVMTLVLKVLV